MGKDGRDGAALPAVQAGRIGSPDVRVKVREQKLVHSVVGGVRFQQNFSNV